MLTTEFQHQLFKSIVGDAEISDEDKLMLNEEVSKIMSVKTSTDPLVKDAPQVADLVIVSFLEGVFDGNPYKN